MSSTSGTDPDLTRKERREQARAQRKALEDAERARSAQRRRLIQLGGAIGVVVVIIVVIVVATSGGSSPKLKATQTGASIPASTEVQNRFAGIPQKGTILGSPNAPVTMEEFADLQCPFCKEYTLNVFPTLVAKYVREGKVKMEFHNFDIIGAESPTASDMAEAAGLQNKLWNFVDLFYNNQQTENSGYVTEQFLTQIASGVPGLDVNKALKDRSLSSISEIVAKDNQLARAYGQQYSAVQGFSGTPSFLIYKTNGAPQLFSPTSLTEPSAFEGTIEKLLKS
jgi:protein-disulfide isomerase